MFEHVVENDNVESCASAEHVRKQAVRHVVTSLHGFRCNVTIGFDAGRRIAATARGIQEPAVRAAHVEERATTGAAHREPIEHDLEVARA